MLTLNEQEEKVLDKIIAAISDYIQVETIQTAPVPVLSFPGLEIRQNQHRVLLAANPGIVLTRSQIFEAVWNMDSNSCQSSISTVICNLRKKIEPDSKNPTYIKTVLGVGYKFDITNAGE